MCLKDWGHSVFIRVEVQSNTHTNRWTDGAQIGRQSEPRECATASLLHSHCQSQHLEAVNTLTHIHTISVSLTLTRPSLPTSFCTEICFLSILGQLSLKRDIWLEFFFQGLFHDLVPLSAFCEETDSCSPNFQTQVQMVSHSCQNISFVSRKGLCIRQNHCLYTNSLTKPTWVG